MQRPNNFCDSHATKFSQNYGSTSVECSQHQLVIVVKGDPEACLRPKAHEAQPIASFCLFKSTGAIQCFDFHESAVSISHCLLESQEIFKAKESQSDIVYDEITTYTVSHVKALPAISNSSPAIFAHRPLLYTLDIFFYNFTTLSVALLMALILTATSLVDESCSDLKIRLFQIKRQKSIKNLNRVLLELQNRRKISRLTPNNISLNRKLPFFCREPKDYF
ncbi:hypothetical protein OROGR_003256 [Orobanche gracilis]